MAIAPLPADAARREVEILRISREGYHLLELWVEVDGTWYGRFLAPDRVA